MYEFKCTCIISFSTFDRILDPCRGFSRFSSSILIWIYFWHLVYKVHFCPFMVLFWLFTIIFCHFYTSVKMKISPELPLIWVFASSCLHWVTAYFWKEKFFYNGKKASNLIFRLSFVYILKRADSQLWLSTKSMKTNCWDYSTLSPLKS